MDQPLTYIHNDIIEIVSLTEFSILTVNLHLKEDSVHYLLTLKAL